MMKRVILAAFALANCVRGDLPIHATLRDITGDWVLHLSALSDDPNSCGSRLPNRNVDNLAIKDPFSWMVTHGGGLRESREVTLGDNRQVGLIDGDDTFPHRSSWSYLPVKDGDDSVGRWTPIYDEGIEIRLDNGKSILTGFFDYRQSKDSKCKGRKPTNHDQENNEGDTICYETDSGLIKIGWYTVRNPKTGSSSYGCWTAEKSAGQRRAKAFINVPRSAKLHLYEESLHSPSFVELDSNDDSIYGPMRRVDWDYPSFLELNAMSGVYACQVDRPKISKLPRNFSAVPEPFNRPGERFVPVVNQGQCGSCFAIAAEYVVRSRAAVGVQAESSTGPAFLSEGSCEDSIPQTSVQSVLSCSFMNQGCSGGYPFMVGRWMMDYGLPSVECMPYTQRDTVACRMDLKTAAIGHGSTPAECSPEKAIYVSDWGYVGGCYECCSEAAMMEEIYNGGPIVAALDVPKNMMKYTKGIFNERSNDHARMCDDPGNSLNGWEFTNHAVVIVGWGEETNRDESEKYWIVRNSWGPTFGNQGYLKLARGVNLGGIEAQAVFLDPDFKRGYLKKRNNKAINRHFN